LRSKQNIGASVGLVWLLGSAVSLVGHAPPAIAADPFAASVLACAAESERDRRLECYDRAVASYTARLGNVSHDATAGAAPVAAAGGASVASAGVAAATPSTPISKTPASTTSPLRHVSARVTAVDYFPNHVVVHLDNDQVWQQDSDSEASGDLNLQVGDTVTIDRQMGSYWLSGRKGGAIQVKLKAP